MALTWTTYPPFLPMSVTKYIFFFSLSKFKISFKKHLFWFQKKLSQKDKNIEFSLNLMSILPQQCCEDWNTGELARIGQVVTSPTTLATTNCQN